MHEDLKALTDYDLARAADKARQQEDTARGEAIEAERALRAKGVPAADRARNDVRRAGIASALVAGLNFLAGCIRYMNSHQLEWIDVLTPMLLAALSFGVFKGSRVSITVFCLIFLAAMARALYEGHGAGGIFVLVLGYFLLRGIAGSFTLHRLNQAAATEPAPDAAQ